MRKKRAKKRVLLPDPRYNDTLVTRFVNNLMWDGKKSLAFKIFYDALDIVESKSEPKEDDDDNGGSSSAFQIWKDALTNVMPHVIVRSRRVGGSNFQIPVPIQPDKKVSLAIKWLIEAARKRNEKSMALRLATELLLASKGEGSAVKKREDVHKMANANKAFSHLRF